MSFLNQSIINKALLLHFIPVCIGSGICIYFSLNKEPIFLANCLICILFFVNIFITKYKKIFASLFFVCLGMCVAQLRTITVDTPMLTNKINGITKFYATIDSCEKTPDGVRFVVSNIDICGKKIDLNKMILSWKTSDCKNYEPGTKALFKARIYPLSGQYFPLAYDFKKQQYFKGISAKGFISDKPKIIEKSTQLSIKLFFEKIRYKINRKIESVLHGDVAAISKALITGEKSDISQDVRSCFANSGTAHLLAISGLHMGIIGFFIFWLFRMILCCVSFISQFYDVKKIAAVVSLIFVTFYLYISGCSVPSVRAFIMHALIICGILCNRVALSMRSIAIAATIILLFTPEVIAFPGFQMSFSAVIAIVAQYENRNILGRWKFILGIVLTTFVASIPTSLFSMFSFNQLTLNSISANIICIPLMTFIIMPLVVICLFLLPFSSFLIQYIGEAINVLVSIVKYASTLPGSHFTMATPTPMTMIIFIFSGLVLTLIRHRIRFIGIFGIACGMLSYYLQPIPDIFVSPYGTIVGVKTEKRTCFNKLNRFKSMITAWTKSVGLDEKENLYFSECKPFLEKTSKDQYVARVSNREISIGYSDDNDIVLDKQFPFARLIYSSNLTDISNKDKDRPWS